MPNPFFQNQTSPNGATAPKDNLNNSTKRYFRGYNKFNLTRPFFNSERYADINLMEVVEGVEGDRLKFGNKHLIRSRAMNSVQMFDLYKKKTYFAVNNAGILPINWEKVYKQPNKGDDVDYHVNCVSDYLLFLHRIIARFYNEPAASEESVNYIWRVLLLLESIHSNGSLLASMNCHLSNLIKVDDGLSFDKWLEETYSYFDGSTDKVLTVFFPSININKPFSNSSAEGDFIKVSTRELLDMMRTFSDFSVYYTETESQNNRYDYLVGRIQKLSVSYEPLSEDDEVDAINFSRLIAYQLVCTQFYTRDSVDNIYNHQMYLDNAKSTILNSVSRYLANAAVNGIWPQFSYNGTKYDYDVFSGKIIDIVFAIFYDWNKQTTPFISYNDMLAAYHYLHMIFFYRKSLRYADYFVGAKTLPYSPMDITADVISNGVSALDMTRSIIAQRFANAVERARNTWKDYISDVMGGVAAPNKFEPRFLASSTSLVSGFEVENTASIDEQGKIVTLLKSGNSNYVYEIEVGEPCIVVGVSTYEVPRVYSATVDRFFKHTDRFNMFNKFFQNIGDQEITQNERNSAFSPLKVFGYTPRHMEYKQRYPIASGAFVEYLPGYAFITDNKQANQNEIDLGSGTSTGANISSYYLRNRNSEFDRFFDSLTGLTLASYYHFELKYNLICEADRQMEYSPSIL